MVSSWEAGKISNSFMCILCTKKAQVPSKIQNFPPDSEFLPHLITTLPFFPHHGCVEWYESNFFDYFLTLPNARWLHVGFQRIKDWIFVLSI